MLDSFSNFTIKAERKSDNFRKIGIKKERLYINNCASARKTNMKRNLKEIITALLNISVNEKIVFPIPPRTKKYLKKYGLFDTIR